jgi:outer membrane receptor protein involved in Fe transport
MVYSVVSSGRFNAIFYSIAQIASSRRGLRNHTEVSTCDVGFDIEEDRTLDRSVENTAVSLTVNWDLSESITLTSISSWDDGEFNSPEGDGTPYTILAIEYDSDVTQVSQDLRRAGLDYTTESGHLLYVNYSHGYRNGAFNGQAFNDPSETEPVDAERVDAVEVGFKSACWIHKWMRVW